MTVTYLVTGASGFIGSALVRRLSTRPGAVVRALDIRAADAADSALRRFRADNVTYHQADIRDLTAVTSLMDGVDHVVHLAAESNTDKSFALPVTFAMTNCVGSTIVALAAAEAEATSLVQVSSDHVYGNAAHGASAEGLVLRPRSPHAAAKASGDLMALSFAESAGLAVAVVRLSNVFGPWQAPDKLVSRFVTNLLSGLSLPVYGDGKARRDWLFVEDCCDALERVIDHGEPKRIYDVQTGEPIGNLELALLLCELTGRDVSAIRSVTDTRGADAALGINTSHIRSLGWSPGTDRRAALAATVEWYGANSWWWKPQLTAIGATDHPADRYLPASGDRQHG